MTNIKIDKTELERRRGSYGAAVVLVRAMPWEAKVTWAKTTGRWSDYKAKALKDLEHERIEFAEAGDPIIHGISSSDINHVTMGRIEHDLIAAITLFDRGMA